MSLTHRAHKAVREVIRPGDRAIDATAGNGGDTVVLAEAVGPTGRVWAFDLQAAAIERTRERVAAVGHNNVELRLECHSLLGERDGVTTGPIRAVMFNLGYLPGSDHALVTQPQTTRRALDAAAAILAPGGRITVLVYRGHPGGREESETVSAWLAELASDEFSVKREYGGAPLNDASESAPWLAVIERLRAS
jgi:predicted methyltransferase